MKTPPNHKTNEYEVEVASHKRGGGGGIYLNKKISETDQSETLHGSQELHDSIRVRHAKKVNSYRITKFQFTNTTHKFKRVNQTKVIN